MEPVSQTASRQQVQRVRVEAAGFWIRFVAAIIDGFVVAIVQYPIVFILTAVTGITMSGENASFIGLGLTYLISFGVAFGYFGFFYTKKGATLGKMDFNLAVVNHTNGAKLTWGQVFVREIIGKMISGIIFLIGYLMVAFRSDRRALHDLMSGSQVIRKVD